METSTRRVGLAAGLLLSVFAAGCADISEALDRDEQAITATISTDKATYNNSEQVQVTFGGLSGSQTDWIAIANASDPDTTYLAFRYTEGVTSGTFAFGPLPNGNYEARAYFDWNGTMSYNVEARVAFTVQPPPVGITTTTDATHYSPGSTVTVNYTGLQGTPTDWIAIALPGSDPTSFVRYAYTSGTVDGSVQFAGLANGIYVARSFNNDSYTLVQESAQFSIGNILTMSATTYQPGEQPVVNFLGLPPSPTNWIAIAAAGAADTDFIAYQYVSTASGQLTFNALPSGNYEARAYLNDSYTLHASTPFTVASGAVPVITTNKASYVEGEIVTTTYTLTGNPMDWVGISVAGSPATSYVAYAYVEPDGNSDFGGSLAPGNYEARLYANDGFTILATVAFTVTAAPPPNPVTVTTTAAMYTTSEPVLVNYTSLGGSQDWIGIAVAGSPDNAYVQFVYTNGVANGQASFSGLAPGNYEARGYKNDSFTVEDRATFSVQ